MQGQERPGMSMAWSSSMVSGNKGNNTKDVISPNPSVTTTSPTSGAANTNKKGHNRTSSRDSIPLTNVEIGSAIPLVRSRTAPQGRLANQHLLSPTREASPQRERSYSGSGVNNTIINDDTMHNVAINWQQQQQQTASNSPSRQQYQEQVCVADPDSQEQALFEQRLCEDIYGVAVRKINQNGKSNLRYVKCLYVDMSDILHGSSDEPSSTNGLQNHSSSRSVSSRHSRGSRGALSRFLGVAGNHSSAAATPFDYDAHRSLLYASGGANHHTSNSQKGKIRVLTWGKKKDVTVPLERFTAVRKGKVNDRTKRNTCEAARILSLVTADMHSEDDKHAVSLDIEAPTRLDRDKFAKAFSRFLNVPLLEEGESMLSHHHSRQTYSSSTPIPHQEYNQHKHLSVPLNQLASVADGSRSVARSVARSIKSDMTPQSWKGDPQNNSIPDIALTATNSHTTNGNGGSVRSSSNRRQQQHNAPLPVVTTRIAGAPLANGMTSSKPPRNLSRRGTPPPIHPGTNVTIINNNHNNNYPKQQQQNIVNGGTSRAGSESDDPPLASLPSSTRSRGPESYYVDNINNSNAKLNTPPSDANKGKLVLEIPVTTKSKLFSKNHSTSQNLASNTPATSATVAFIPTQSTSLHTSAIDNTSPTNITHHYTDERESIGQLPAADGDNMDRSVVSSITGVGFDQDLVEELHLALERMRVELEESRAEASRAVKVAEQAIQSAENSSSKDWNNTVTHKAAEAAATAQKKSAEAMAKARIAEEQLEMERKVTALLKRQMDEAEQVAAHWQTRAAAAEVQRFAVAEALESERKKSEELVIQWKHHNPQNQERRGVFESFVANDDSENASSTDDFKSSNLMTNTTMAIDLDRLRSNLARESARRRKLQDELQDLRGSIRVYCRLKGPLCTERNKPSAIEMVSNEILLLHRSPSRKHNKTSKANASQTSFEFDGILSSDMSQEDVYAEFEAICASVVEGFKICIMTYGQANSGKTHTILGDVHCNNIDHAISIENEGVKLQAMKQLFSILEHRRDLFHDIVTINIVEVHDERLIDLLAGTEFGEEHGKVEGFRKNRRQHQDQLTVDKQKQPQQPLGTNSVSSSRPKLEIKTNRDGDIVVRGVLSVKIRSFQDILRLWTESLSKRSRRLTELGVADLRAYDLESHVVATVKVTSTNISTGATTMGKMQFVDFASSEIVTKRSLGSTGYGVSAYTSKRNLSSSSIPEQLFEDWKFTNKSLNTFREVILARNQYKRMVPYRNSTITHILSDSLEADTKVVVIACLDAEEDVADMACTLQFAQEIRKVVVGKATRHTTIAACGNSGNKV